MSVESDLEAYAALLRKWNTVQNLVSRETIGDLWPRHIADSLQLMKLVRPADASFLDLGSGGGFPAIPMAIASRGSERRFTLLEPIAKKAAFLRVVARDLALPVTVQAVRTANFDSRETFDVVTSRAMASLPDIFRDLSMTDLADGHGPFIRPTTRLLLHKGRNYRQELAGAAALFDFDVLVHPSESDAEGVILEVANLRAKSVA